MSDRNHLKQTSLKEEFIGSQKGGGRAGLGPQTKSESSLSLFLHFAIWLHTLFLLMDFPPFFIISNGDHDHIAALASHPKIPIPRGESVLSHRLYIQNPRKHLCSLARVLCLFLNQLLRLQ